MIEVIWLKNHIYYKVICSTATIHRKVGSSCCDLERCRW